LRMNFLFKLTVWLIAVKLKKLTSKND